MIFVARKMSCAFIWYAHAAAARQAGGRDDMTLTNSYDPEAPAHPTEKALP